ncbi:MAG: hypothetical protein IH905_05630 [Proteobacteria bacterium]|nr:hypothetical protein [Pseudomonadota bacterium]
MNIEGRLERVEKRLRIFQGITAAVIVLLGAVIIREAVPGARAGSEPQAIPEKIRARAFEVVNPDGVIVARLGGGIFNSGDLVINGYSKPFSVIRSVQIYGAGIAFHSKIIDPSVDMSQILVTIGADDRGGLFAIYNDEEKLSVGANATASGDGEITIADRNGRPLVRIGADGQILESSAGPPTGRLKVYNSEGRAAVTLRANARGSGIVELSE